MTSSLFFWACVRPGYTHVFLDSLVYMGTFQKCVPLKNHPSTLPPEFFLCLLFPRLLLLPQAAVACSLSFSVWGAVFHVASQPWKSSRWGKKNNGVYWGGEKDSLAQVLQRHSSQAKQTSTVPQAQNLPCSPWDLIPILRLCAAALETTAWPRWENEGAKASEDATEISCHALVVFSCEALRCLLSTPG